MSDKNQGGLKPQSDVTILPQDKKPAQSGQGSIAVKLVRWSRPLQIPGRQSDMSIKTETLNNGKSWTVEYIQFMRHFKITYSDPARNPIPEVGYVHEANALSWEPL